MNKEKFNSKKEANRFCYDKLPIVTHLYKGHRHWIVEWEGTDETKIIGNVKFNELNADGKPRMSVEELNKQIKELSNMKISAVKLARIELCFGLKEGLDYCNKVWNESN